MPERENSPVTAARLGYVGFETPDVDRLVEYYTKSLDFVLVDSNADQAFLTTDVSHHSVVIERSEAAQARSFVGFPIHEDLDAAERRLREAGYKAERRSDIGPATPDVLIVEEPLTGTPLHLYDAQSGNGVQEYTPLRPTKLGHVAAYTPELAPLQDFYQGLLGFKWSDTIADFFVFLRCNADHHTANFIASATYRGMHHIAFETRDLDHLQSLLDHLATRHTRLEWGPGRHGPGHNVFTYHRDPDGNIIELFTQLDTMSSEASGYFDPKPWHEDHPQYPKTWDADLAAINSWGPVNAEHLAR